MKGFRSIAAAGLLLLAAKAGEAQERDAFVLGPGQARLSLGATYVSADARFGSGSASLAAALEGRLTPNTFSPLPPLQTALANFFEATSAVPGAGSIALSSLTAGDLEIDLAGNYRQFPVSLAVGVFPRVELVATLPVYRSERLIRRFTLEGGTVGLNAYRTELAAQLGAIHPSGAILGASALVPLASSPLGRELQSRVVALTGRSVALPGVPLGTADLAVLPTRYSIGTWKPGDLEVEARFQLTRTFGQEFIPTDLAADLNHRVTVVASGRLPTGRSTYLEEGIGLNPRVGAIGAGVGAVADVFRNKYWLNAGAMLRATGSLPLSVVTRDDGSREVVESGTSRKFDTAAEVWATPRLRIHPDVSLAFTLHSELWRGDPTETSGILLDEAAASRHSIGASVRYSNVATTQRSAAISFDGAAGFRRSFDGSGGVPATDVAYVQVSFFRRLWGVPTEAP